MRKILFRGKRKDSGEWVEGSLISFADNTGAAILESKSRAYMPKNDTTFCTTSCFEVISETVGQYTGFTDKNGNKIFEGDIVVIGYNEELLYVAFDGPSWECLSKKRIHYRHRLEHGVPYEIVGNIHNDLDYERLLGGKRKIGPDIIARFQPWQEG